MVASSGTLTAARAVTLSGQALRADRGIIQALRSASLSGEQIYVDTGSLAYIPPGGGGWLEGAGTIYPSLATAIDEVGRDLSVYPALAGSPVAVQSIYARPTVRPLI
jgi:hypothetical protein